MYAVIKCGGKQYKVKEGDILNIDKLSKKPKDQLTIDDILAINNGSIKLGNDIKNSTVKAEVITEGRDKKIIIYKKRRRKDSKLKRGFRKSFTRIKITQIVL